MPEHVDSEYPFSQYHRIRSPDQLKPEGAFARLKAAPTPPGRAGPDTDIPPTPEEERQGSRIRGMVEQWMLPPWRWHSPYGTWMHS